MTETYVELHARSAFSFLQGASLPEELAQTAANLGYPAMALLDRDGIYGSPRFHLAAKKAGIRAHIGAEITCTDGFQYPLLAESRTGYQNLCRLVTRMKLRAKKGEGAVAPGELAEFAGGLICLALVETDAGTRRHGDTAKTKPPDGAMGRGGDTDRRGDAGTRGRGDAAKHLERLIDIFGRANVFAEIQRHMNREEEACNQAQIAAARRMQHTAGGDQWGPLCYACTARSARCAHLRAKSCAACRSRPSARDEQRTAFEIRHGNGAAICRSAGSHRQYAGNFRAAQFYARGSGLRISALSRARWRNHDVVPAPAGR